MYINRRGRRFIRPFRSLHALIWIVGLFILITRGRIFPGIFILILISLLFEAVVRNLPRAYEDDAAPTPEPLQRDEPIPDPAPNATIQAAPLPAAVHREDLLPTECPNCGGPIRSQEVMWTGERSASCPYCGTNLPMGRD